MKKRMTEGRIFPQLITFALPLVFGSILQLSYNLFDFIVLGWFSTDPVIEQAAVGVANPIMSIFIAMISGLCLGIAIHSSNLFGKNDIPTLKRQFTSVLIVGAIFNTYVEDSDPDVVKIEVIGFPAKYVNFRPLGTDEKSDDYDMIRVVYPSTGKQYEESAKTQAVK